MSISRRERSSSAAPRLRVRDRRSRLGIEALEQRLALAVAANLVNGQLQIIGDGAADTITLDHTGTNTIVVGKGSFADASITNGIVINSGPGNDTVNILATTKSVTVNGQGGTDAVNIGKAGNVQAIQAAVGINNAGGITDITIDDSANPVSRAVTLGAGAVAGTVAGLAPATISYKASETRVLRLRGGTGGNTFTVNDTVSSLTSFDTLDDAVNVLRTTKALEVFSRGDTKLNVGLNNSLKDIKGEVRESFTTLTLNGQADTAARSVTFDVLGGNTTFASITGLAPAEILYGMGKGRPITVNAGGGADTFHLLNAAGFSTKIITLNTGAGADSVNVRRTDAQLRINGEGGLDTVNVGLNGSVRGIRADMDVLDLETLTIDDSNDTEAREVTIEVFDGSAGGSITGLAPAAITYNSTALQSLVVHGGIGGNTFAVNTFGVNALYPITLNTGGSAVNPDTVNVRRTTSPLTINGQSGQDTVNLGLNGVMAFIDAPITITNTGSRTALTLDDRNDVLPRNVTLADAGPNGTVAGLGAPTITYVQNDLRSLTIHGGKAGNTFTVGDTFGSTFASIPTRLNTGAGNDTVNVLRTTQPLIIDGQTGIDAVNVGLNNSVRDIAGAVGVRHATSGGSIALSVNDQADTTGRVVSLDTSISSDVVFVGTITGLAPATIDYQTSVVRDVRIRAGGGGDVFTVFDTAGNGLGLVTRLDTGGGNDAVNVRRTTGPIEVNAQGGSNNMVNFGSIQDFTGTILGSVGVASTGGKAALTINDQGSNFGHADVTLSSRTVGGVLFGDVLGQLPGGAIISYVAAEASSLTLNANPAGNSFLVADTVAGNTTLNAGTGFDTVRIRGTSRPLTVNGQNGLDNVFVGDPSVQGIRGELTIRNTGSRSHLIVDDRADPGKRVVTMGVADGFGTIVGLAPATIKYVANDVSNVFVDAGNAGNTFTVQDTIDNVVRPTTTISTGTGADVVNVQRTSGALTVNGQNGRDTVNVGLSGSVQAVRGTLNVTNVSSFTSLNLDDQADAVGRTVSLGTNPEANQGSVVGLAPAVIFYRLGDLATLTVNGGAGGDTFRISGTASNGGGPAGTAVNAGGGADTISVLATAGPLTVNAGAGNDVVNIGSTFNTLDSIQGAVTVNGQADGDTLNVNDQGSTSVHIYNVTPTQVQRLGAATITYSGIENLRVNKGPTPTGPLARNLRFKSSIRAGRFTRLSGRLADADAADTLSLTVDWGDGSRPTTMTPNRAPFHLSHRYALAGMYTVRVIWTDSARESNFRDLSLAVRAPW